MDSSGPFVVHRGGAGERGCGYTRMIGTKPELTSRGALYLTYDLHLPEQDGLPVFPVHRSDDDGTTWRPLTPVRDTRLRLGHRLQPSLFELPQPFAGLPAGTLLLAGNAIPADESESHLVIYASTDCGASWQFCSEVDSGGPAVYDPSPGSATSTVWEPHLDLIDGRLVCYYSDERYKDRGMLQVLVHRTSTDLRSWSAPVLDVGVPDRRTRPGMLVTAGPVRDEGWLGVIEVVGDDRIPVHLLRSKDGLDWGDAADLGVLLRSAAGTILSGTPNITLGPDGLTVLVTGRVALDPEGHVCDVALLSRHGVLGPWEEIALPVPASRTSEDMTGYSQTLLLTPGGSLVQATTLLNAHGSHDVVVGRRAWPTPGATEQGAAR